MRLVPAAALLAMLASPLLGCACRARCAPPCAPPEVAAGPDAAAAARHERAKRLMDLARERSPYLPMMDEDAARAAIPSMKDFPRVPNLIRIAAAMPKTMEAEMQAWEALKQEGTVDKRLMSEVFWVVSSVNECGHCMGHIVFGATLGGATEDKVLGIEDRAETDPKRLALFAFARKVSREPARVTRADVESLRPWFTDAQIVEWIFAINRYATMNRLAEAFGSPLEKDNVFDPKNAKPKPEEEKPAPPKAEPAAASIP